MWDNSCFGVFFDDDGKSFTLFPALFFPLLGLGFLFLHLFSAFSGLFTALIGHSLSTFRFYCGIKASIGIIKEHPAVCLYAARCSVFVYSVSFACFFSMRGFV